MTGRSLVQVPKPVYEKAKRKQKQLAKEGIRRNLWECVTMVEAEESINKLTRGMIRL